jgi:hypothetical protein
MLVVSLAVMLPWPLFAACWCQWMSLFDLVGEIVLLFGSVTLLFLLPVMLIAELPEPLLAVIVLSVWVLVLVLPPVVIVRRGKRRKSVVVMFVTQAAFSFIQAGLGVLMILGKSV